ncbi:MAG: hypothetical protein RL732_1380 [Bacteroidota bacterium]
MPGILNISLDFELHWGVFDKMPLDKKGQHYFKNTRYAFPLMVELFQRYQVQVTWAVVGMLYNAHATEWRRNRPKLEPTYENKQLSAYHWVTAHGLTEPEDPFHFAPDLIALIEKEPLFEIGTHTYGHYYCQEPGQHLPQFRADLEQAIQVAATRGHKLRSLVFPRNQFRAEYLAVCAELGITVVRSNPDCWYWNANRPESLAKKVFRTGDAYTKILGSKAIPLQSIRLTDQPLALPASRLYRAWKPAASWLNRLKMERIIAEMEWAAANNGYYHLWWHPHNFGYHPDECLKELEKILQHYHHLFRTSGFKSLTMSNTRDHLLENSLS